MRLWSKDDWQGQGQEDDSWEPLSDNTLSFLEQEDSRAKIRSPPPLLTAGMEMGIKEQDVPDTVGNNPTSPYYDRGVTSMEDWATKILDDTLQDIAVDDAIDPPPLFSKFSN